MKKLTLLYAAIIAAALPATGWANDPWFMKGYYDWTEDPISVCTDGTQLKVILAAANLMNDAQKDNARYDDNEYARPDVENGNNYAWMVAMLRSYHNDHNHIGKWEGYTDSYQDHGMNCYLWNYDETKFDQVDIGPTGVWTVAREIRIYTSYFHWEDEYDAYICTMLIEGFTDAGNRHMNVDCMQGLCP